MGNHASTSSCFLKHSSPKAKLIDGNGNLRQVKVPITAAEVMLEEEPGHVISPVDELQTNQRISAMRADDELLAGKVYLLVRLGRVNGMFTQEETAMIHAACDKKHKSSLKRRSKRSAAKVLPAMAVNPDSSSTTEEKESDYRDGHHVTLSVWDVTDTGFSGYRFRKHRQRSPVLESISEVY